MQLAATPTAVPTTPVVTPVAPIAEQASGKVQGVIADFLRGAGDGYQQATKLAGTQADKAAIHPFEAVSTVTGVIKDKTANIKYVNKATGILHTIGGFGMLLMTANASGVLRSPGITANELAHKAADLIDGRKTSQGFTPGWFTVPTPGVAAAPLPESGVGSALSSMGMK